MLPPRPPQSTLLAAVAGALTLALDRWGKYRSWWWYDNVAHLSAGVALGSLVARDESTVGQDVAIVAGVAVLWECLEYAKDVRPWDGSGAADWPAEDTVLDTILVLLGAWWASREAARSE